MYQMLIPLLILFIGHNQRFVPGPTGPSDVLPPLVGAYVPQDLLEPTALPRLVEELRQFRLVAAAFSSDPRDPELLARERLERGVRAMRAVGVGRILECRILLLEIVAACEHPDTEPYVLDALAALRTLGEPEAYFMDLIAQAPSSYHRAAGAMIVLGWTPTPELVGSSTAATRACSGMGVPHSVMQRSLVRVRQADRLRQAVSTLLQEGHRTAVDKQLLHSLWGLHCKTTPDGPLPPGSLLYSPRGNYARIQLWQRAAEDPAGLRASIEAMTLYDFLLTENDTFHHLDPEKRLATFREQVLSLLPESVRQAKPASQASGD